MHVIMITGSYPPDYCGVGDYTAKLVAELKASNNDVEVVAGKNWNFFSLINWIKTIVSRRPDVVHFQYPTVGFGKSLVPQLLSIMLKKKAIVVTIHEFYCANILRKLAIVPFIIAADHLIFTTSFERNYILKYFPWARKKSLIIPIGSNVRLSHENKEEKDSKAVAYFGLIMPKKGMEQFIALAQLSKLQRCGFKFIVIGAVNERHKDYYDYLRKIAEGSDILWEIDHCLEHAATLLARNYYAYLPFPDGVSERRGSFFAALEAGLAVITTKGEFTTKEISEVVDIVENENEALSLLNKMVKSFDAKEDRATKVNNYLAVHSWQNIVKMHMQVYDNL